MTEITESPAYMQEVLKRRAATQRILDECRTAREQIVKADDIPAVLRRFVALQPVFLARDTQLEDLANEWRVDRFLREVQHVYDERLAGIQQEIARKERATIYRIVTHIGAKEKNEYTVYDAEGCLALMAKNIHDLKRYITAISALVQPIHWLIEVEPNGGYTA